MGLARFFFVLTVLLCGAAKADETPRRIVSMNLCADQMVLLLAEPGTVASVSFLTADPAESPVAHLTAGLVLNHGEAEEVIALDPDLIVTGRYTTVAAKLLLRRLDYPILELDIPQTFEGVRESYLTLGEALGRESEARTLIATLEQRFSAIDAQVGGMSFGSVLILDANGFTVGRPSLVDQVLTRIGLTNVAAQLGVGDFGQVTLEAVLLADPDYIVRMMYRPDAPSLASQTLTHPALKAFLGSQPMIPVPQSWVNCGGPYLADAAEAVFDAVAARRSAGLPGVVP